jgi:hypothetical protein
MRKLIEKLAEIQNIFEDKIPDYLLATLEAKIWNQRGDLDTVIDVLVDNGLEFAEAQKVVEQVKNGDSMEKVIKRIRPDLLEAKDDQFDNGYVAGYYYSGGEKGTSGKELTASELQEYTPEYRRGYLAGVADRKAGKPDRMEEAEVDGGVSKKGEKPKEDEVPPEPKEKSKSKPAEEPEPEPEPEPEAAEEPEFFETSDFEKEWDNLPNDQTREDFIRLAFPGIEPEKADGLGQLKWADIPKDVQDKLAVFIRRNDSGSKQE